jgi:hypothetical protein
LFRQSNSLFEKLWKQIASIILRPSGFAVKRKWQPRSTNTL